jgi:pimeloyl-ACP methyl ester carboxylesterase
MGRNVLPPRASCSWRLFISTEESEEDSVNVEIVSVTTSDGLRLDGAWRKPESGQAPRLGVDVVIFHHGVAGNFYNPSFVDRLGDELLAAGCAVLRVNNRGHDIAYNATRVGVGDYAQTLASRRERGPQGAAYEIVDESRLDWRAWVDFAESAGYRNIVVWGHSLGAVKTIYYCATEPDERVRCAVASSPPRQRYSAYLTTSRADEVRANVDRATQLIESGEPNSLLHVTVPNPNVFTARTYIDKYGPQERYDIYKHLSNVRLPMLLTLGGLEGATPDSGDALSMYGNAAELASTAASKANLRFDLIEGADHFYTGRVPALWEVARGWLEQVGSAEPARR